MNSAVTISDNRGSVSCLCLLPHNRLAGAITEAFKSSIKIWSLSSYECVAALLPNNRHNHVDLIQSLLLLPNNMLASASNDFTIKIWNLTTYVCVYVIETECTASMASISMELFASKGVHSIQIWHNLLSVEFDCIQTIRERSSLHFSALAVLPNKLLVSGSKKSSVNYPINLYELRDVALTGSVKARGVAQQRYHLTGSLLGHRKEVTCLKVLQYGRMASASMDLTIKIWCMKTNELLATLESFACCLLSLPNSRLASAGGRLIRVWDLSEVSKGRCVKTLVGHSRAIKCIALLPNCRIASGGWDRTCQIFDQEASAFFASESNLLQQ
jgi:WD40 repeat protein